MNQVVTAEADPVVGVVAVGWVKVMGGSVAGGGHEKSDPSSHSHITFTCGPCLIEPSATRNM